ARGGRTLPPAPRTPPAGVRDRRFDRCTRPSRRAGRARRRDGGRTRTRPARRVRTPPPTPPPPRVVPQRVGRVDPRAAPERRPRLDRDLPARRGERPAVQVHALVRG